MIRRIATGIVLLPLGVLVLRAGGTPLTRPLLVDVVGNVLLLLAVGLVALGLAGAWLGGRGK